MTKSTIQLLVMSFWHSGFLRSFTAWAFILALLFPTFGPMAVYHFQKKLIRQEVKKQILSTSSIHELVVFSKKVLLSSQIRWIDDQEFVLNGFYYDVVRWQDTDSGSIVLCWPDYAESALERLRTETALSILLTQKRDKPAEFIGYLMFIKGFFKSAFSFIYLMNSTQVRNFQYYPNQIQSFSRVIYHPPEVF
ncbi:MAG: hypothetical protein ACK4EX_01380 [Thermaurantimonas sp.]|uniref:hypothetical protein n=1 Tax=Thermaurantimonas sp. TaxID=2681568 RepID=UPI00391D49FA